MQQNKGADSYVYKAVKVVLQMNTTYCLNPHITNWWKYHSIIGLNYDIFNTEYIFSKVWRWYNIGLVSHSFRLNFSISFSRTCYQSAFKCFIIGVSYITVPFKVLQIFSNIFNLMNNQYQNSLVNINRITGMDNSFPGMLP